LVNDTSKATLSKIDPEVGQAIIEYREHQKVVSSYGQGFLEHIHPIQVEFIHLLFHFFKIFEEKLDEGLRTVSGGD
jgi:hypothetical protein